MEPLRNTIIYLLGPPGVGKYTVGKLISEQTGARLLHNHYWSNIILNLVHQDGITPLPLEVWARTEEVRRAVFSTVENLSPPDWSFVITHAAAGEPDDIDHAIISDVSRLAASRGARLCSFSLKCSREELVERVQSPERATMMKDRNPETAHEHALLSPLDPGIGHHVAIDTSGLDAETVADRIIQSLF